jgi:hypothetical protein
LHFAAGGPHLKNTRCLCRLDKGAAIHIRRFAAECQWHFFGFHRYFAVFLGFCAPSGAKRAENPPFSKKACGIFE